MFVLPVSLVYKDIHKYTDKVETYIAKHKIINLKKN